MTSPAPATATPNGSQPDAVPDAELAERAWRTGDPVTAIAAADRALAADDDPHGRAAGVAAAAAAADGALVDATHRWQRIAERLPGGAGVEARCRAALTAALTGHIDVAARDLAAARAASTEPLPRGMSVLLDGVDAVVDAVRGRRSGASRRLAGLAAAMVPTDPFAVEPWDELAATAAAAGADRATAAAMLAAGAGEPTPRRRLLGAWLDLRAGRLAQARAGLSATAGQATLRRTAVLAAAVSVGLARRSGEAEALAGRWHRVAPVVAGADVEVLLLDVWGELSVAAAAVAPAEAAVLAHAMDESVARAGSPAWCVAEGQWWRLQRATTTGDADAVADAASALIALADGSEHRETLAAAARSWAAVFDSDVDATAVRAVAVRLVADGQPWEALMLAAEAARRADDPAAARTLLGSVRGLRPGAPRAASAGPDGLSERERDVGRLVLDGLTHREIGARLYISPKTVEQHVARLRQKLATTNRAELVAALRARLDAR